VRLAESGTMPIAEVARQLGVHLETLRNWRRKSRQATNGEDATATVPSLEEENRRLRRENARLLEERDILKKATAGSTDRCNTRGKFLRGCDKAKCLAWSCV
jgi:transposase